MQSANATNSSSDREALNAEVQQLLSEIDRVANQTSFNGTKLLDGSFTGALFQVGANAGQTIGINTIVDANIDELGKAGFAADVSAAGVTGTATASGTISGITVNVRAAGATTNTAVKLDDIKIENGDTVAIVQKKIAQAMNDKLDQTGLHASVDGNNLKLTSLRAGQDFVNLTGGTGTPAGLTLDVSGFAGANAPTSTGMKTLQDLDISDFAGAQRALEIVDKALTSVSSSRADMGAIQNRFSSTIANLQATSENLSASRSRIRDTDYAKETAELTRTQILQQAGTAMLAQANASTQNVLSLLG